MHALKDVMPKIGDTEQVALDAGTVWWDGDLFSGKPNWAKLLAMPPPRLTRKETAFLDGEVEELCQMLNDWEARQRGDLPPEIWRFIKNKRFFGLIIPKEYDGLEMSALAHSAIVTKLASRSLAAAVSVMVPNSLGPAELLLHYGTQEQKKLYLPRLARGEEIPCFALTEPNAGSDAASTKSIGVLCHGKYNGREVLGIRLNWSKRYITLGPIATLIGLAFRLTDPHKIFSKQEDLGITCALIPTHLPGVVIGARHDPMGIPFQNGPNEGHDVFIPADFIIGGLAMAGQGWKMLMECLSAGRSISLPAVSVAGMQVASRVVSAYGIVRKQFNTPIEKFEGIEEPLARIGGLTYMMNAARVMTAGAVDRAERPSVVSAIVKSYLSEAMRKVANDAMDIVAGAGICRGPRNLLEPIHTAIPVAITVEGANILTRSMIIFGQGSIRGHLFIRKEIDAIAKNDVTSFDQAFFGHLVFFVKNTVRTFTLALTESFFVLLSKNHEIEIYFKKLSRMSAAFAFISDSTMAILGGALKKHENLSGRLADALAWMYLASSTIKRFVDEGRRPEHLPYVRWSCEHALFQVQTVLLGILQNFPSRFMGRVLSLVIFPIGHKYREPNDALGATIARSMTEDLKLRDSLTSDIFIPNSEEPGLGQLETALNAVIAALPIEEKMRSAARTGAIITQEERNLVAKAEKLRDQAIQVDSFRNSPYQEVRLSRVSTARP